MDLFYIVCRLSVVYAFITRYDSQRIRNLLNVPCVLHCMHGGVHDTDWAAVQLSAT